jgi:peptidoglycan hydrolase CwlO-like protein
MNKIERAIEDTRTELKRLRNNKLCIDAKIEALEEQLESLQSIERTHSIPHSNPTVVVSKEEILKERWESWKIDREKEVYEDNVESAYTDGFSRGALWMQYQLDQNK